MLLQSCNDHEDCSKNGEYIILVRKHENTRELERKMWSISLNNVMRNISLDLREENIRSRLIERC